MTDFRGNLRADAPHRLRARIVLGDDGGVGALCGSSSHVPSADVRTGAAGAKDHDNSAMFMATPRRTAERGKLSPLCA